MMNYAIQLFMKTKKFKVKCPICFWTGMNDESHRGNAIADTGDSKDLVCPKCIIPNGTYEAGEYNALIPIGSYYSKRKKDGQNEKIKT